MSGLSVYPQRDRRRECKDQLTLFFILLIGLVFLFLLALILNKTYAVSAAENPNSLIEQVTTSTAIPTSTTSVTTSTTTTTKATTTTTTTTTSSTRILSCEYGHYRINGTGDCLRKELYCSRPSGLSGCGGIIVNWCEDDYD